MAVDQGFVQFVKDQIDNAGEISHRMMFGGCTVYCNGKVVALICDDQLFVKPTEAGRAYIGEPKEAPAYEGAKISFLIEDGLDDADWLTGLVAVTEQSLPKPKARKKKKKK